MTTVEGLDEQAADARAVLEAAGKRALVVLGERPLVAETPAGLLDLETTPTAAFYVRNNGTLPADLDVAMWRLTIDGEVEHPVTLSLRDLEALGETVTRFLVLECAGNGRAGFTPATPGNQWTHGGVGCAAWTGVPLRIVLERAGLRRGARYTAHHGADAAIDGAGRPALSRGIPTSKALDPSTLLVWAMNGEPLSPIHGGPLRLLVPGWAGSASQKWLTGITLLDREHDGPGMIGTSYRVPIRPMSPGDALDPANLRVLESMPVRSVITSPEDGRRFPSGTRSIEARGAAWAGDLDVRQVDLSIDGGARWQPADLRAPRNRYDWQRWIADLAVPGDGEHSILARATDSDGNEQPLEAKGWNPGGYGANAMHRITVRVG